jgi:TolB protein
MIRKSIILVMAVLLLALVNARANGVWQSFPVCVLGSDQIEPAVSGETVVWTDKRSGGYDIYSYNLAELNEYPIETITGNQTEPAISGDIIVWTNNKDIFGYDLSGAGKFPICVNTTEQEGPAISGNIVVWRDNRNFSGNSFDIYGCDISNISEPEEFSICTEAHGQHYPDISGDIVVWMDVRNGNPDIYGYDLSTETEFPICTNSSGQYNPRISGHIVVWLDDRNGNTDIYGIDLSTLPGGSDFPICTNSADQFFPVISGNLVVWQDTRNGAANSDIYGYDIGTASEFSICTENGNQINPSVDGDTVVWQRDISSSANIYGAYRPAPVEPSVLTIVSPNGGESLLAGALCTITWQSSGPAINFVRLDYSVNSGGGWVNIVPSVANVGLYEWSHVPPENSQQCLVRVRDSASSVASDASDGVFTIFECSESLTADLNGDCYVDIADFAMFCEQWLEDGNPY